jgi:hypothetical protein
MATEPSVGPAEAFVAGYMMALTDLGAGDVAMNPLYPGLFFPRRVHEDGPRRALASLGFPPRFVMRVLGLLERRA